MYILVVFLNLSRVSNRLNFSFKIAIFHCHRQQYVFSHEMLTISVYLTKWDGFRNASNSFTRTVPIFTHSDICTIGLEDGYARSARIAERRKKKMQSNVRLSVA